ncbi:MULTISPECIES: helix-turn-helix transcriptional regulator [Salipiger]|uniref:helix-turn-helix transcriptional regulator n=1 Tax=Salipiger TaxID=263377 RepID=UPI003517D040
MSAAAAGTAPVRVASLGQQPGWQYRLLHDRPEHTLIWLTRGQGRATVEGLRRGLGPHNALFIPAGTLFALEPGLQSLGLVLHCPVGGDLWPGAPRHLRIREGAAQAELTGLLDAMMREQNQQRGHLAEALGAHASLVSVWLRRQGEAAPQDDTKPNATRRLMRLYTCALSAGFRSDRSVSDYAAALGVTPTHLTRTARAACDRTAATMLAERKLHEAQRLLAQPDPPVNRIAESLGFHSAPYFTRFIRSHTGHSPTELRRGRHGARPGLRH